MPDSVYKVAKHLVPKQQIKGNDLEEMDRIARARPAVSAIQESQTFLEYKHKSSIFTGITKQTDDVTGQSTYISFRRVSDNSDDNSWIHRGLNAYQLAEKAFDEFEPHMQEFLSVTMDDALTFFGIE